MWTKAGMKKTLIILFWLIIWQVLSMLVNNPLLFASPVSSFCSLLELVRSGSFWSSVWQSALRINAGFFTALICGLLLGALAWRFPLFGEIFAPVLSVMKAVPVASFVILVLVWFGSYRLSVIVSFLIVFPQIYFAVCSGLRAADQRLLEMAHVFHFSRFRIYYEIYRPALYPYLISACSSAIGMGWKSGIAAEVIGTPSHSIGESLYLAKVYFMTSELFAWTFVIILISMLSEKIILLIMRKAGRCDVH